MNTSVPCLPSNAPFTTEQRAWINGFLAGLFSAAPIHEAGANAAPDSIKRGKLTILFGSQTGSAEGLAKKIGKEAIGRGYEAEVIDMAAFTKVNWLQVDRILLVTSTWGDGEPPDNAVAFWKFLNSADAPRMPQLTYAVLGLGDKNYASFCGAAKNFDARLTALGAKQSISCAECDVDYETAAKEWLARFWSACEDPAENSSAPALDSKPATAISAPSGWSRTNPYPARLLANRLLNGPASAKETRHFEFGLADSGLNYEAGDALGICPSNDPALVREILSALGFSGEEAVSISGATLSIREALHSKLEVTRIPRDLLVHVAERAHVETLLAALHCEDKQAIDQLLFGWDILNLFASAPGFSISPQDLAVKLKKLQPRLYSISSSPKAHAGQVHLTISVVRFEALGRRRGGVCSTYLADRLSQDTPVPIFVHHSPHFRPPTDLSRAIIMVGPGTGIAPFRAFLHERVATGASGKNWLFFGDQRRECDFLYADEIESFQARGALHRFDAAFSRDQKEKIYVQDRMLENAAELWKWLEEGAHFYVCGDAKRMAKDVDAALHTIVAKAGGKSAEAAAEYVQNLKSQKRYQRDVY